MNASEPWKPSRNNKLKIIIVLINTYTEEEHCDLMAVRIKWEKYFETQ